MSLRAKGLLGLTILVVGLAGLIFVYSELDRRGYLLIEYQWGQEVEVATIEPTVIKLGFAGEVTYEGGLIAADLNADGQRDFVVTQPGFIGAYELAGSELWTKATNVRVSMRSENYGLPGHHAAGVQVTDIDGDGNAELLYLTLTGELHVVEAASGKLLRELPLSSPSGTDHWEHLVVANFRGAGDKDLLLQTTNVAPWPRIGRFLAAFSMEGVLDGAPLQLLWQRDDFIPARHSGARLGDLDLDGRDEVVGSSIIGPDGRKLAELEVDGHADSIFIADIRPDIPGLEVVVPEEGNFNRVFLYNVDGVIWQTDYRMWEPQNLAIGEFDLDQPGLEIWNRSRFNFHQRPFVFNADKDLLTTYEMADKVPGGWAKSGIEEIYAIDWTGEPTQLIAAKERHRTGDVVLLDAISGDFVLQFKEAADRLYVADISGDWREEIVVQSGSELHIYENPEPAKGPGAGESLGQPSISPR